MKKKYFVLALMFLCLLKGQSSFGQTANLDYDEEEEVCTRETTYFDQSQDCFDIYITTVEEYYCKSYANIKTYTNETHVPKECGTPDSGDCRDPFSSTYPCDEDPTIDCAGVLGGSAYIASCGCIGGTTGITECPSQQDCAGVVGGSAYMASCGCIGGTTGITECSLQQDCAGVEGGNAYIANCGCIGGNTGISVCPDCLTSTADLDKVFPNAPDSKLLQLESILNKYMGEFGIDTKEELQHFLAQAGHESAGFSNLGVTENLNFSVSRLLAVWPNRFSQTDLNLNDPDDFDYNPVALGNLVYGNRLGNTSSGDGYKYRGRGIFQLTGKTNYQEFQNFYNTKFDPNINIIFNPDLLTTDTNLAVISALWFYQKKVLNKITVNVNTDISVITKKINGGLNGLNDRVIKYNSAKTNIKCNN